MKKSMFRPIILITIFILLVGFACVFSQGDNCTNTQEPQNRKATSTSEIVEAVPTLAPEVSEPDPQSQTWLVLFYFDADDPILEEDMYFDLNEIEKVGSTDRVQLVAQIDRYKGAFEGDGNWTTARRYYLTQDDDLNAIHSQMISDLGEVDMGNSNTLVDFATWAIKKYPADRVVLIMSDHGSGWPGGWSDDSPKSSNGNWIHLNELQNALGQIIKKTGIRQFEMVGMDACLMSMLDVYNGLAPYTHYAIASQETEPSLGWAYDSFLSKLVDHPQMSGADLSKAIVDGYINEDLRITDDASRQQMLSKFGITDQVSAGDLAQEMGTTVTITAADLTALPQLNSAVDYFVSTLKNVDQAKVAEARSYAQAFYNVFDENYPSPYIDLSNFADFVVSSTGDQTVSESTQQLKAAISKMVIAEKHGDQRAGATGVSVYFPVSDLYWNESIGVSYYTEASKSLVSNTLWDDFLAFHYSGKDFAASTPSQEPQQTQESQQPQEPQQTQEPQQAAPGASQITIAPLTVSQNEITTDGSVNIQTDITGDNVAYIYLVGLLKNSTSDKYLAYYIDYLQMNEVGNEKDGVIYPVWNRTDGKIHISIDWNLAADGVCDDNTCVFALVNPDKYTTKPEKRLYYVEGWYVYSDTGEKVEAAMYFNNKGKNLIRHIIANPVGNESIISPSELTPKAGDQFITVNNVLTFNDSGQFAGEYQEGNTLTFGNKPFNYGSFGTPDPGNYLVGIMVMDMDGNKSWQFAPVAVSSADQAVAPQDFAQEGSQQSNYHPEEHTSGGTQPTSQSEPLPLNSTESSNNDTQSSHTGSILWILIPMIVGLVGMVIILIMVKQKPKKGQPIYVPYTPPTVPPSGFPQNPPQLVTAPPQLETTPPMPQTSPAKLEIIVLDGILKNMHFPLGDRFSVGRATDNDLVLPDPKVSRHHLVIQKQDNEYQISDLNSSFGTFLNNNKIQTPTLLKQDDVILIGDTVLSVNNLA
jgi:hypothetical protein